MCFYHSQQNFVVALNIILENNHRTDLVGISDMANKRKFNGKADFLQRILLNASFDWLLNVHLILNFVHERPLSAIKTKFI